ncbi:MAG: methyltransferase domain-containing protein [Actinomycetota bacterium]
MAEDGGYHVRDEEAVLENERLGLLAEARDPRTRLLLEQIGIRPGWHCLELGAGAGTISRWMAERVGDDGRVMSTDIDLRFHAEATPNMIVREHDVTTDRLPSAHFDVVHARAVLQHIPEREAVLDKLTEALKPGGWIVVEDANFLSFAEQAVPEDYRPLHEIICSGQTTQWRDPNFGLKILGALRERGYVDLDVVGEVWAMRPGEAAGEWWFLALERAGLRLVEAGLMTRDEIDAAIAAVRTPGFVMASPLSMAVLGRRPAS